MHHPDPIMAELRAIRTARAAEHSYDLDSMFAELLAFQETCGRAVVTGDSLRRAAAEAEASAQESGEPGSRTDG
ncbi:MAG: hypothetical protein R3F39_05910 [Myxococcota bacterium]